MAMLYLTHLAWKGREHASTITIVFELAYMGPNRWQLLCYLTSMDLKFKWLVKRLLNNTVQHVRVVASSRGAYFRNETKIAQPPFICKLQYAAKNPPVAV